MSTECESRFEALQNRQERSTLPPTGSVSSAWLDRQKAARLNVKSDSGIYSDLSGPGDLDAFGGDSEVRDILEDLRVEGQLASVHLSLDGEYGRRLTQRVSRLAYNMGMSGVCYQSKLALRETCWAVFDREEVTAGCEHNVSDRDEPVQAALIEAATRLGLTLPSGWSADEARP